MRSAVLLALLAAALGTGLYFGKFRHQAVIFRADHPLAPEFTLRDINGGTVALSAYRGKVVLLDFWATWCDPCKDEIPRFMQMQNELGPKGLQVVGVSMDDDPQPVRDFYQQYRMNYPVAMGDAKTGNLYGGVLGVPIAFVIGRDGRIYAKHVGTTQFSTFDDEVSTLLERPAEPVKNN